jgi:hypothetical protein
MAKKAPPPFMKKGEKKEEKGKGKDDGKCAHCGAPMKNGKCTKCGYKAK